jgi:hypothetical protein
MKNTGLLKLVGLVVLLIVLVSIIVGLWKI